MTSLTEHLSQTELLSLLDAAHKKIQVGSLYAHYRDPQNPYKVINLAIIEATQEPAVVYQKEYGSDGLRSVTWIRPLASWLEMVSFNGVMVPRFRKISPI